jgi:hypothetical protein
LSSVLFSRLASDELNGRSSDRDCDPRLIEPKAAILNHFTSVLFCWLFLIDRSVELTHCIVEIKNAWSFTSVSPLWLGTRTHGAPSSNTGLIRDAPAEQGCLETRLRAAGT